MYISRFVGVLAVLLAVAAGPHGQPLIAGAAAPGTGGIAVSTTAHGLKVTIAIPRRVYPRDALVRASLGFQNLSSHTVYYEPGNGMDMLFVANGRGERSTRLHCALGRPHSWCQRGRGGYSRCAPARQ